MSRQECANVRNKPTAVWVVSSNASQRPATGCDQNCRPGKRSHGGLGGLSSGARRFAISPRVNDPGLGTSRTSPSEGRMRATPCNRVRRGATACNRTCARAERTHGGAVGFPDGFEHSIRSRAERTHRSERPRIAIRGLRRARPREPNRRCGRPLFGKKLTRATRRC